MYHLPIMSKTDSSIWNNDQHIEIYLKNNIDFVF